ncbi:flagellar basal-body rod protein FlgF [Tepiditoga spiralis]|uniref:Flagellar basal-body rod protein FlgF n=1 Tax=Tepiditoga spiralis TaxID=2108365 RepID=A0A7G1G4K4_9BACT|nr:flagellar hook-basal body protein [Tepiditoga spiralis]BBE29944.1 flagellar basal-body rod protein FlgF [Tepiditoga spiralis]
MRGIYSAGMGMLNSLQRLNSISNNLANVNTNGYKKDTSLFKAILEKEFYSFPKNSQKGIGIGKTETAVVLDKVVPEMTQGKLVETNNNFDMAILGKGFFKVQSGKDIFYTRDGEFKLSADGYLVDNNGNKILDETNNPIRVQKNLEINENGNINNTSNKIGIVELKNLSKKGTNYFIGTEVKDTISKIKQGYVEKSNVDTLKEMVNMISANREFEILQKAVQSQDSLNAKAIEITRT